MTEEDFENRGKQFFVGALIIATISGGVICLVCFWRLIPGWVGETVGMIAGLISSPFTLEVSFFLMGLVSVVLLNSWRRKLAGDDFVEVDEKDLPEEFRCVGKAEEMKES